MRTGIAIAFVFSTLLPATAQQRRIASIDYATSLAFYRPRVAVARDGRFAVAWESLQKLDQSEQWQIAIQRFAADGAPADSVQFLTPDAVAPAVEEGAGLQNADLSFDAAGRLWVGVERAASSPRSASAVAVVRMERAGRLDVVVIEDAAPENADVFGERIPRIEIDGRGTVYLAASGSDYGVQAFDALHEAGAIQLAVGAGISDKASAGDRAWYDVAAGDLSLGMTWQKCSGTEDDAPETCRVMVQLAPGTGYAFLDVERAPFSVGTAGGSPMAVRPSLAMNGAGQGVVVWIDYRTDVHGRVLAQRFDARGRPAGAPVAVSEGDGVIDLHEGSRPEAAMRDDGSFLVVWTEDTAAGLRALGRAFDAYGKPLQPPFLLDDDPDAASGFADVATDGRAYRYVWLSERDGRSSIHTGQPGPRASTVASTAGGPGRVWLRGYPNPFTKSLTLEYSLERAGHVRLVLYDLLGREVKTLIDHPQEPGSYHVTLKGDELAMGFYISRLQQGEVLQSRLLIRQ